MCWVWKYAGGDEASAASDGVEEAGCSRILDTGGGVIPNPRCPRHRDITGINAAGKLRTVYIECKREGVDERVDLLRTGGESSKKYDIACLDESDLARKGTGHIRARVEKM